MNIKKTFPFLFLLLSSISASAVIISEDYELSADEIQRLMEMPEVSMRFQNAPLPNVLRALAEASNMPFIGLPRDGSESVLVDMTVKGNAFESLEQVAETYGYALVFQKGIWLFRPIQQVKTKLVSKVYNLKNIHLSSVEPDQQRIDVDGDTTSARPQSVMTNVFSTAPSKLIDDIETLLAIDPDVLSASVQMKNQETSSVLSDSKSGIAELLLGTSPEDMKANVLQALKVAPASTQESRSETPRGAVIANPDRNSLFIVATRNQHEWISAYLDAVDCPRKLILLETRFIEVRKEPSMNLGLDWSSILSGNYDITATDATPGIDGTGEINVLEGGTFFTENIGGAILSAPELNVALNFLRNNADARNLQHPSQVTVNNRPVVLRSVRQEPFQSGSSTNASSGTSSTTNNTEYLPIGTTISLLPRIMEGENVELNILINVSDLLGYTTIGDAQTPITSSRDYSGQAIVCSGNTLAIAGLEALLENEDENKVPILGDIPFFGYLFKRKSTSQNNFQLIMFITATVMDGYDGGVKPRKGLQQTLDYFDSLESLEDALGDVDQLNSNSANSKPVIRKYK
ncbi:MAG: hypothetical protein JW739_07450 [Opitutales bacterium]|nr:hypothetical protein [Opitutales bacterium]